MKKVGEDPLFQSRPKTISISIDVKMLERINVYQQHVIEKLGFVTRSGAIRRLVSMGLQKFEGEA